MLHTQHPHWTGDHLYGQARAIVGAEIAHITYAEFLPHLVGAGTIAPYEDYDPTVDARITEEFAGAAYRFGHSIVSPETFKLDNHGALLGTEQELRDAFFEPPSVFAADTGADGILRHLASDESSKLDVHIVEDLRNFLSDPPAALDLAAINIARAHDLGLGSLNQTRVALGFDPYTDFDQITSDAATAAALEQVYGSVDAIDLWTGGLSENAAPGAMVGQTFQAIIAQQFTALRDGDRFWFEHQGFDAKTLNAIEHTTLGDIITRNTDTGSIQDDVFVYYDRHSGENGGVESENPDAPQLVVGTAGHDSLTGGALDDILVAAKGKQEMTGLAGDDRFVFSERGITATITDFQNGHDKIDVSELGVHGYRQVHVTQHQGNAVIEVAGDHIELVGVNAHQLDKHDFVFA
jgi:Ca2+-binding RTX toxin-like protein